jgi:multidrug resistance protein, MATE family
VDETSYGFILRLALPMILSMTGQTLMSFMDGVFLARYSQDAVAALGPAGMSSWLIICLFSGAAGYTSTFVAQYRGADMDHKIGASVWQGIYFAIISGLFILLLGTITADCIFAAAGHSAVLVPLESAYFKIACWSAPAVTIGSAVSGFFIGRGDMKTLMAVQVSGQVINAVLDYGMIFGRLGFPEMGMAGAATASLVGQCSIAVMLICLMLKGNHRRSFGTWASRAFDPVLFRRFFTYGMPGGFRFFFEMLAWTAFLFFVGRIDDRGLAATTVAWRINQFAFFPVVGLSMAVQTVVGHSQGRKDPDASARSAWRGIGLAQVWMLVWAFLFFAAPGPLVALFDGGEGGSLTTEAEVLLRFVAVYSLLDGLNVIVVAALQGAGDTRWTMVASVIFNSLFICCLAFIEWLGGGLYTLWTAATIFIMLIALLWLHRLLSGRWRTMLAIEETPVREL